jgi:hypothetical protein
LVWQSARWEGKCQPISGFKNKPPPGPSIRPPESSINKSTISFFQARKKRKKKVPGLIRPSVVHSHSCQHSHRQNTGLSNVTFPQTKQNTKKLSSHSDNNNDIRTFVIPRILGYTRYFT